MSLPKMQDLDVSGKKVLLRVDFNVPLNDHAEITDDMRIKESLPTIEHLLRQGSSVIILSHLGRPKNGPDEKLSLKPCAKRLSELLHKTVLFAKDATSQKTKELCQKLQPGELLLIENLRFYPAEEDPSKDPSFAKTLSSLGDLYVNDAFGTAHRTHSSTALIASFFPKKKGTGLLMQKEIQALNTLLENPLHPFFAIVGGSKISSKLGVLESLIQKVDGLFIGGGMAYTFLHVLGYAIGDSIFEKTLQTAALQFLNACTAAGVKIYLPEDLVIADAFSKDANKKIVSIKEGVPKGWQGMDIGPSTLDTWKKALLPAATIFWNGPLGVFELEPFSKGTNHLSTYLSSLKATTIVGGGDSVLAINQLGIASKFTHVSTGGGASLEYIENGSLPGIDALKYV